MAALPRSKSFIPARNLQFRASSGAEGFFVFFSVWQGSALTSFGVELAVLAGFEAVCVTLAFLFFRWEN
jgi:DNA mismatch repair ATPase MutS